MQAAHARSSLKTVKLMDLPPIVVCRGLHKNVNGGINYPEPLLNMWRTNMQPPSHSPSGSIERQRAAVGMDISVGNSMFTHGNSGLIYSYSRHSVLGIPVLNFDILVFWC